jgi:predicted TIM-barrel enzyme
MSLVYPVIHQLTPALSLTEADVAFEAGADGIFLISHTGDNLALLPVARQIKHAYPDKKVGINLLGHDQHDTIQLAMEYFIDMVWFDYCGVTSSGLNAAAMELYGWKQEHHDLDFDIFASIAFKYQAPEEYPAQAAYVAASADFIPTTSGAATGRAPEFEKILSMSNATNGLLAVASGMTVDNVSEFAPYLTHILVSTGVSSDFHHLDKQLLTEFIKRAHLT